MASNKKLVTDPTMQLALERFQFTAEAEFENRTKMKSDTEFYVSDQWDDGIKNSRVNDSRPCLTINRLPQFTRQITNGLRQNMPSVRTIPVNDSDEDVAKIFDGLMRHIQEASNAGIAYSTANNAQVISGQGFFRLVTEYCKEDSFDQEIKIKRIKNALSVYVDPSAIEPDYSDAHYMFITEDITHEEFKKRYPDKQVVTNTFLSSRGDEIKTWLTGDKSSMRIAEYFSIEEKESGKIYLLEDGSIVREVLEGQVAVKERPFKERKVIWRMISGIEVLETKDWAGKYIPIIPVIGEDIDVNGKRILKGMVRDAKDPQRMLNYWSSAQTEMIALAPKAPFIVAEGQIEGYKSFYESANRVNHAYLPYKPTSINGTLIGPPQRQTAEPPVQAMVQALMQASEDLKATTGIYDAGLGARGNEVSGKAINARKTQGDVSNYHYIDNFSYSMLHLGRVLLNLIPKIYDAKRVVRILGEDGTSEYKTINGPTGEKDANGVEKIYDVTTGDYDVVVDTGPSYKTKRQEDSEAMAQLLTGNPELWKIAGDLFVKAMDWPDAQQLADRLKKTLPPELQEGDPNEEIPLKVKAQLDQYGQLVEQMTNTIHHLQNEKDQKVMELETKERIALEGNINKITIEAMKQEHAASFLMLGEEIRGISARLQMLNVAQPIDSQNKTVESSNSQIDNVESGGTMNAEPAAGVQPLGGTTKESL